MKNALLAFFTGFLITVISIGSTFGVRYFNLKRNASNDRTIIQQLQTENKTVTRQLTETKGIIRNVKSSIELAGSRIGEINNGLNDGGDIVDASIRITEELFGLVGAIEASVSAELNNWNSK